MFTMGFTGEWAAASLIIDLAPVVNYVYERAVIHVRADQTSCCRTSTLAAGLYGSLRPIVVVVNRTTECALGTSRWS